MNPYFAYSISFTVAMAVYLLGWSNIYPRLSAELIWFLGASILIGTIAGFYWNAKVKVPFQKLLPDKNVVLITGFIYVLWIFDFIYADAIPILKILLGQPFNYRLFGIPTLHVFTVTFSSFYTVYLFHLYLSTRKKRILLFYSINLFAAILIYSRAMFMFNLLASLILLVPFIKMIPKKILLLFPVILILLFFLFGVFGNLRVSHEGKVNYDNSIILKTGQATQPFKESIIPNEFFWTYIYTTSSLANLQKNINNANKHISMIWFLKMVNNEMIFDFISKRINSVFDIPHPGEHYINGSFNVSTLYSVAYSHLGWFGMVIMFCYVLIIPVVYQKWNKSHSPFFATGFAILITMYFFMAYDNTIRFTGLSFQLAYPIIFEWLESKGIYLLRKL